MEKAKQHHYSPRQVMATLGIEPRQEERYLSALMRMAAHLARKPGRLWYRAKQSERAPWRAPVLAAYAVVDAGQSLPNALALLDEMKGDITERVALRDGVTLPPLCELLRAETDTDGASDRAEDEVKFCPDSVDALDALIDKTGAAIHVKEQLRLAARIRRSQLVRENAWQSPSRVEAR